MSYNIELCPIENKGKSIQKTQSTTPSISTIKDGFSAPLIPLTCGVKIEVSYDVPLVPTDCDLYKNREIGIIEWWQGYTDLYNPSDPDNPTKIPNNYWFFECSIPQGFSEGTCDKCFSEIHQYKLVGGLGFQTGWKTPSGNTVRWQVDRNDLPFPGEFISVITVVPGEGDMFKPGGVCTPSKCGAPAGSCYYPSWEIQTSGTFWTVAYNFFVTPTWTAGEIVDYYTDILGWAGLSDSALTYPDCSVYGDVSLKYKVKVEGHITTLTSAGFSAYGIGTWVSLKKVDNEYFEPYDCGIVGDNSSMVILPWHIRGSGG